MARLGDIVSVSEKCKLETSCVRILILELTINLEILSCGKVVTEAEDKHRLVIVNPGIARTLQNACWHAVARITSASEKPVVSGKDTPVLYLPKHLQMRLVLSSILYEMGMDDKVVIERD